MLCGAGAQWGFCHTYVSQEQSCSSRALHLTCCPSPCHLSQAQSYVSEGLCAPKSFAAMRAQGGRKRAGDRTWYISVAEKRQEAGPSTPYNTQPGHCSWVISLWFFSPSPFPVLTDKLEKCAGFSLLIQNTSWLLLLLLSLPLLQAVDFVSL